MGRRPATAVAAVAGGFLVGLLGAAPAAAGNAKGTTTKAVPRPNIIVVMTDDMRADDLQVMQYVRKHIGTPGMTFTNSIVTFPVCCPSRATFLTGQYAHNHGVADNHLPNGGYYKLDHSETLPVWLQRAGYATVHMGKYLNDYGDLNQLEIPPGWTEWHGAINLQYYGGILNEEGVVVKLGTKVPDDYATDLYAARALDIVRRRAPSDQPFFLWLSFYAPHAGRPAEPDDPPLYGTPAVAEAIRDRFATKPPRRLPSFNAPTPVQSRAPLTDVEIAQIDENYRQRLESLVSVDYAVQRLVSELTRRGELSNTVIFFTSDNGFFLGERRIPFGKLWFYEEALRVPLVVRGPGIPAGSTISQLVANLDLAPTIMELAQASLPEGRVFDGKSLAEFFRNPAALWSRKYLIESPPRPDGAPLYLGVRTTKNMYVEYPTGQGELYDLVADPYELNNLWAVKGWGGVRDALARSLAALKTCVGLACRRA